MREPLSPTSSRLWLDLHRRSHAAVFFQRRQQSIFSPLATVHVFLWGRNWCKGFKDAFNFRDTRRYFFLGVDAASRQTAREGWVWAALDLIDYPSARGKGLFMVLWLCRPPDEFGFSSCWRLRRLLLLWFLLGFVGWAALLWAWGGFFGPYSGPKGEWTLNPISY